MREGVVIQEIDSKARQQQENLMEKPGNRKRDEEKQKRIQLRIGKT